MAVLDGVRLGPLDPDRGENFGQVGAQSSARMLIRHHIAQHPPLLVRALARQRQDERSDAVDREEAEAHARELYAAAGEPLHDESKLAGFAVRGDDESPELQVVTFTWTTKGGRTGKGFMPYRDGNLPNSVEAGDEAVRIKKLKDAGLPWQPTHLAQAETRADRRKLDSAGDLAREVHELRARLEAVEGQKPTVAASAGGGSGVASSPQTPEGGSSDVSGTRGAPEPDDEFSQLVGDDLTGALEEAGIDWTSGGSGVGGTMSVAEARSALRARAADETDEGAPDDDDEPDDDEPDEPEGSTDGSGEAAPEPWAGYEGANAQDVRRKVREEKDPALARAVLAYEQRPGGANRSTVVAAANEVLDHTSG